MQMECHIDHCHLFVNVPPTMSPADVMKLIKGTTGSVLKREFFNTSPTTQILTRSYFVSTAGDVSQRHYRTLHQRAENERGIAHEVGRSAKTVAHRNRGQTFGCNRQAIHHSHQWNFGLCDSLRWDAKAVFFQIESAIAICTQRPMPPWCQKHLRQGNQTRF